MISTVYLLGDFSDWRYVKVYDADTDKPVEFVKSLTLFYVAGSEEIGAEVGIQTIDDVRNGAPPTVHSVVVVPPPAHEKRILVKPDLLVTTGGGISGSWKILELNGSGGEREVGIVTAERVVTDEKKIMQLFLEVGADCGRMLAKRVLENAGYVVKEPCDECGDTGVVDLAFKLVPCSKGCKKP